MHCRCLRLRFHRSSLHCSAYRDIDSACHAFIINIIRNIYIAASVESKCIDICTFHSRNIHGNALADRQCGFCRVCLFIYRETQNFVSGKGQSVYALCINNIAGSVCKIECIVFDPFTFLCTVPLLRCWSVKLDKCTVRTLVDTTASEYLPSDPKHPHHVLTRTSCLRHRKCKRLPPATLSNSLLRITTGFLVVTRIPRTGISRNTLFSISSLGV